MTHTGTGQTSVAQLNRIIEKMSIYSKKSHPFYTNFPHKAIVGQFFVNSCHNKLKCLMKAQYIIWLQYVQLLQGISCLKLMKSEWPWTKNDIVLCNMYRWAKNMEPRENIAQHLITVFQLISECPPPPPPRPSVSIHKSRGSKTSGLLSLTYIWIRDCDITPTSINIVPLWHTANLVVIFTKADKSIAFRLSRLLIPLHLSEYE